MAEASSKYWNGWMDSASVLSPKYAYTDRDKLGRRHHGGCQWGGVGRC